MNNAALVRVRDGGTHLFHQMEARRQIEPVRADVIRDRHARNVLHHEVRLTVGCHPAVEQSDDVGMLEKGENLTLGAEAPRRIAISHRRARDFDGDAMREESVAAFGEIDVAHPALTDALDQAIRTDPGANLETGRPFEERPELIVRAQQRFDFSANPRAPAAPRFEQ